jgi:hypothetical protein
MEMTRKQQVELIAELGAHLMGIAHHCMEALEAIKKLVTPQEVAEILTAHTSKTFNA